MSGLLFSFLMFGLGIIVWMAGHQVLAIASGWHQLSQRFATSKLIDDPHADWYNVRMGRIVNGRGWFWLAPIVRYRRSVVVRMNFRGIALDRSWTCFGHKPLFIPWDEVKFVEHDDALPFPWMNKERLFGHVVRVGIRPKSGRRPVLITIGGHDLVGKVSHFAPLELAAQLALPEEKGIGLAP